jgi:hypothetical protein
MNEIKSPADYDIESRINAASTLIGDLLSLTTTSAADKAELAVAILGYDPRIEK